MHSDIFTSLRLDDPSAFVLSPGPDIKPDDWRRMMPVAERDGVHLFIDMQTWTEAGYAKRLRRLFGTEV